MLGPTGPHISSETETGAGTDYPATDVASASIDMRDLMQMNDCGGPSSLPNVTDGLYGQLYGHEYDQQMADIESICNL